MMTDLNFIILKVNDLDVSQLARHEAVQMFLKADAEPLRLEVRPRPLMCLCSQLQALQLDGAVANASDDNLVLSLRTSAHDACTQTDEHYFNTKDAADLLIEQEHNIFEQCLVAPEIDIEEITLRKSYSNERLGLVVCYSGSGPSGSGGSGAGGCAAVSIGGGASGGAAVSTGNNNTNNNNNNGALSGSDDNELCTEVYISDIQPDSVAGRDGRLRQGDQILQINGKDIKNKEETESLIAENNNAVTLLVSRYLYTDEDDFNDPSVADLDVEDEDDDEEEEEEEGFYDEQNLTYENCFLPKVCSNVVEELDKVLASSFQVAPSVNTIITPNEPVKTIDGPQSHKPESKANQRRGGKESAATLRTVPASPICSSGGTYFTAPHSHSHGHVQTTRALHTSHDYEPEHIYETIPEDSESEPFYCSPYESASYVTAAGTCTGSSSMSDALHLQAQQKQRVAQWLGLRAASATTRQSLRSSSGCGRSSSKLTGTARSANTSITNGSSGSSGGGGPLQPPVNNNNCNSDILVLGHNDEHDNSSSAYNTGGSNNSGNTPLLVAGTISTVGVGGFGVDEERNMRKAVQRPKEKTTTSPKHVNGSKAKTNGSGGAEFGCVPPPSIVRLFPAVSATDSSLAGPRTGTGTTPHYAPQTAEQLTAATHCPQFNAPNLSQYHFVSSQQVSAAHATAAASGEALLISAPRAPSEDTMVWKVKRRPDGTRYIVRRPARNRCALQLSTAARVRSSELTTTTEDDTVSEVKTGRYWSKEERKKHIERARERRQQQQQQQQKLSSHNNTSATIVSTMRISDRTALKLQQQQRRERERALQQQQQLLQQQLLLQQQQQHQQLQQQINKRAYATRPAQHYQLQFSSADSRVLPAACVINSGAPDETKEVTGGVCVHISSLFTSEATNAGVITQALENNEAATTTTDAAEALYESRLGAANNAEAVVNLMSLTTV